MALLFTVNVTTNKLTAVLSIYIHYKISATTYQYFPTVGITYWLSTENEANIQRPNW